MRPISHSIAWTFNATGTVGESTIDGIPCIAYRGVNGKWYSRVGSQRAIEMDSRIEAFKACITGARFVALFAPSWANPVALAA